MSLYSYRKVPNALGDAYEFRGPGLAPEEGNEIIPLQKLNEWARRCLDEQDYADDQAKQIVKLLTRAYDAGRHAR